MQWAKSEASTVGYPSDVAAWVAGCGVKAGYEKVAVAPMLKAAFRLLPHLDAVLIAAPPEVEREPVGTSFVKMARTMKFALYAASRESVLPRLRVRLARVDDHDDLLPLVASAANDPRARADPVASPGGEASTSDGARGLGDEYALATLISRALDDPGKKCVLVAEAEEGKTGKMSFVGVMAVEAVDGDEAASLAGKYDLAAYDNLMPAPDDDGTGEETMRITRRRSRWRSGSRCCASTGRTRVNRRFPRSRFRRFPGKGLLCSDAAAASARASTRHSRHA